MPQDEQKQPVSGPSVPPGARVSWNAVNGLVSGVTEGFRDGKYLVRLDDGRNVIVNEKSIWQVLSSKTG